jgi:hypothetical protein
VLQLTGMRGPPRLISRTGALGQNPLPQSPQGGGGGGGGSAPSLNAGIHRPSSKRAAVGHQAKYGRPVGCMRGSGGNWENYPLNIRSSVRM